MERPPEPGALASMYLFRDVPPPALTELWLLAPPKVWEVGEVVFRQGDPADMAILLVEGLLVASVRIEGVVRKVGDVRPGELVGETALFNRKGRRTATIVAGMPSSGLQISWEALENAPNNPAIVALEQHLLGTMARRIRKTNQAIQAEWRTVARPEPQAAPELTEARPTLLSRLFSLFGGGS